MKIKFVLELIAGAALCACTGLFADTLTWTASGGGNWSDAAKWSSDGSHTVPQSGDTIKILTLKSGEVYNNDIAGLSCPRVELGGSQTDPYPQLKGQTITLTGGWNALEAKSGRFLNYIPFVLTVQNGNPTNRFNCSGGRLSQRGHLSGGGLLYKDGGSIMDFYGGNEHTGGSVNGQGWLDPYPITSGDNQGFTPMGSGLYELIGSGLSRFSNSYAGDVRVAPPTSKGALTADFWFYSGIKTFSGTITGTRLVVAMDGNAEADIQGDITIPEGPVRFFFQTPGTANNVKPVVSGKLTCATFNQGVSVPTVEQKTATITFRHVDNEIGSLYVNYWNHIAGAENAFGRNVCIYLGVQREGRGMLDLGGHDQMIDRLIADPSYPVTAALGHSVTSTQPARLTMAATDDCTTDASFDGAVSIAWAPVETKTFSTHSDFGRVHGMSGAIIVSNGTFIVTGTNSFPNATALVVADGAVFDWQSSVLDGFGTAKRVELGATATVRLPAGMTIPVSSLVVDGQSMPSGMYSGVARAGVAQLQQLQGEGTLYVKPQGGGVVSAIWVGGGADDQVTTVENWAGIGEWPSMTDAVFLPTFADRESTSENAVLAEPVVWRGVVFDAGRSFSLTSDGEGASLSLGASGILARAPGEGTRAYAIGTPVVPVADQSWECPASAPLTLSGPLDQEMGGVPYTICKQGAGTLTLSGGGSFAGDFVSSNGTIRLSGTHSGSGQISLMSNSAVVVLDNADVAKSISARCNGSFPSTIQTVTNSTNWIRGGLTTVQDGATPQPNIVLGAKSSLTVEGDFLKEGTYWTVKGSGELCVTNCETVKMGCLTLSDSVTVRLQQTCFTTKAANYITVNSGTTLRTEVENALTQSPVQLSGLWELCGKDQTMGRLSWSGNTNRAVTTSMEIRSAQPAKLTIIHNDKSGSGSNRGWSIYAGKVTGQVSLLKRGDQTLYLGSALAATGTLEVAEGVLSVTNGVHVYGGKNYPVCGSWTNCSSVTASETGVLEILHSDAFGKATDVYIAKGAKVCLGAGVSQRVHDLYFEDGEGEWVKQKSGIWGTTASGASNKSDIFFDGPGVLRALGDGQGMTLIFR